MKNKLDKDSPFTLTYQITEFLRSRILSEYKPGDLLPSEKELIMEFEVSSITVKNALEILVNEGLIYRKRGKGTFVAEKKILSNSERLMSATMLFKLAGRQNQVVIIEKNTFKAGTFYGVLFGIDETDLVFKIGRLRSLDGEAYSHEINYFPLKLFPDIENKYKGGSLYAFLEEYYKIIPTTSEEVYKAINFDIQTAKLLNQTRINAGFQMFGKVFDQYNRLITIEESIYRGDKYELKVFANSNVARSQRLIEND